MHKIVPIIFKILLCSMLFMAILDTTLILTEIISIHSKVSAFSTIVQMEVASNNCLPDDVGASFDAYLKDTLKDYRVIHGRSRNNHINDYLQHNMTDSTVTYEQGGVEYKAQALGGAENAKNYGDFQKLVIIVKVYPAQVYLGTNSEGKGMELTRGKEREIKLVYAYDVPCLRYLK